VIVLVRHGRTAVNAGGRLLGRLDPPLDELGERQARAAAAALTDLRDPRLVTSPLGRARQTAAAISDSLVASVAAPDGPAAAPLVDERWIELDYGRWDGLALGDLPADTWGAWRRDLGLRPPGGETLVELGGRVRAALAEMIDEAQERDVVVVSHVSPIKAAVAWALDVGDEVAWNLFLGPASITRLRVSAGRGSLVSFNETGHLGGLVPPVAVPRAAPR
jgi:broad specificity phosphatase PhoE